MADFDAITDVFDLSGNGKGVALNVHPEKLIINQGLNFNSPATISATDIPDIIDQFSTSDGGRWQVDTASTDANVVAMPNAIRKDFGGRYFRRDVEALNFTYFGADPTGVNACDTAFAEAMAYLKEIAARNGRTSYFASSPLRFGAGTFRFDDTIQLHQQVLLEGLTRGIDINGQGAATKLLFPADKEGIIVQRFNTQDARGTSLVDLGNAGGSIIRGLGIYSAGGTRVENDFSTNSGILCRAQATIEYCVVESFPNNGIAVVASTEDNTYLGEASETSVFRCQINNNKHHGVIFSGIDVNVGSVERCRMAGNGGYGLFNREAGPCSSKLNHYVSNGAKNVAGQAETSMVFHNGKLWGLNPNSTLASANATAPILDAPENLNAPWVDLQRPIPDWTADLYPNIPQWSTILPLRYGGAGFMAANGSASFCDYLEGTQNGLWVQRGSLDYAGPIIAPRFEGTRVLYYAP